MREKALTKSKTIDVTKFVKATLIPHIQYQVTSAEPATGVVYVVNNFLSGHVRLRGRSGGQYPYKYLEMIDYLFGSRPRDEILEVCSGSMSKLRTRLTVDINPATEPHFPVDGQTLEGIPDNSFKRWYCDPPYNAKTAKEMYGYEKPSYYKLLNAGSRVVKRKSLLFLLCAQNYQMCPPTLKRIGLILITIVPNNEIRACNIYVKR